MKLPICPYCGRRVSYFRMLTLKTNCDYICTHCKRESKIGISSNFKYPFFIALGISIVIILVNMINYSTDNLVLLAFTFAPMVLFFLLVPFFIILKPYIKYRDIVCERLKKQSKAKAVRKKGAR